MALIVLVVNDRRQTRRRVDEFESRRECFFLTFVAGGRKREKLRPDLTGNEKGIFVPARASE